MSEVLAAAKRGWKLFERAGLFVGNIVSSIFLTVFYFTIFAVFALLYKASLYFKKQKAPAQSAYIQSGKTFLPADFAKEF